MNERTAAAVIAVAFTLGGMIGLYLSIPYSGWVLAVGIGTAWFKVIDD